jgi:hypothetical protein
MHGRSLVTLTRALLLLIFGVCTVSACEGRNVQPGDRDYPAVNPTPTQFLHVHGSMDAALDLNFHVNWRAQSADCRYASSWIEGVFSPYTAWTPLALDRKGDSFSIQVPIDGVLPGRCGWRFDGVSFGGPIGFRTTLIATNSRPLLPGQSPNGIARLRCKWMTEPGNVEGERGLRCSWPRNEDPSASVLGGVLWWQPQTRDLEAHFTAGE